MSLPCFKVQGFRLRRVTFFVGTKKVTKEMPVGSQKRIGGSDVAGIFRLAILARSENGVHPCTPPYGFLEQVVTSRVGTSQREQLGYQLQPSFRYTFDNSQAGPISR